jgi:hypothetical protein
MFHKENRLSGLKTVVLLGALLLACPSGLVAQHGGGGHMGGGTTGGGGLSGGGGRTTGVDVKDDLKGFHAALAVQATSQQIVKYNLMLKSTEAASKELKAFVEQAGKVNNASGIASRDKTLEQAVETARGANKKFLEGFSDRQKSGLKEITKRLSKVDSDLAQQAKALDQEVEANAAGERMTTSAQSLDNALTSFRNEQVDLGEEMGIGNASNTDVTFNITPVKSSVSFANQPVAITTSGVITQGPAENGLNTFKLQLIADMSDLQQNIAAVLRAEIDKSDRCGEQIAILGAALTAQVPAALVVVQLHFERWACLGRDANEMAEGNGSVEVKLTPSVGSDRILRLVPEIGRVDAPGLVGELLRSGSLGDALRDKIADSILSAVRQGGDFDASLPPAALGGASLLHARFEGTGAGKLVAILDGAIRVSGEKATLLTSELKEQMTSQQTMPR